MLQGVLVRSRDPGLLEGVRRLCQCGAVGLFELVERHGLAELDPQHAFPIAPAVGVLLVQAVAVGVGVEVFGLQSVLPRAVQCSDDVCTLDRHRVRTQRLVPGVEGCQALALGIVKERLPRFVDHVRVGHVHV